MNDLHSILQKQTSGPSTPVLGDVSEPDGSLKNFPAGAGLREHIESLLQAAGSNLTGWLLWSEELQIINGEGPDGFERGWLLAGELHEAGGMDRSFQIRQQGRDWQLRTLVRQSVKASGNDLPSAFLETRQLLPWPQLSALKGRKLSYQVAWRINPTLSTPCFRPAEFRFVGFTHPSSSPTP